MNFDTFSIAAIATELQNTILHGRIQRVTQINSLTFGFEIFVHPIRHYLLISAEPQAPRMHLGLDKTRRGVGHETPLMLVLRKYMRGAHLRAIEQPPYERLLYLHFDGPIGNTILVVELLGTHSNLLLLAEDKIILGVARLSKSTIRPGQRVLIPNHYYEPPPLQHKLLPAEVSTATLGREISEASPSLKLARLLPQVVSGVSPLLAREITYRATGNINTRLEAVASLPDLVHNFTELFNHLEQAQWQPMLGFDDPDDHPVAFAAYTLQHLPHTRTTNTFSEAIEIYFAEATAGYAAAKAPLVEAINAARQRLMRRRERLEEDAKLQADPESLKQFGELILAASHQIEPGQDTLEVDWLPDSPSIKLDPLLSASENAQQYFSRYRKAQRAGEEIPGQLKKIALEEQFLEQLEQDLVMAENRPEIDTVAETLAGAGYYSPKRKRKRQKSSGRHYLRLTAPNGATVWVGKNALQNAHLTFKRASTDDLWLHARGIPGAHVIVPTAQGLPSEGDVLWAAGVAAHYSMARNDTAVEVDVTVKKYVRAIKGAAPGLVTYRNESTFRVAPEAPDLDEIE